MVVEVHLAWEDVGRSVAVYCPNGSQIGLFLASVVGIQAWLTLRLKELFLFSVGELFQGVHRHKHQSVQPSLASHD